MIGRQKVLLALLREAGGQASHFQVTKWAFLLRHEAPSRGGSAFYDFLPYKYGPFSFSLFQEAASLVRAGVIAEADQKTWALHPHNRSAMHDLDASVLADVGRVVAAHSPRAVKNLTEYVYSRYPWFTIHSMQGPREKPSESEPRVYTAGYEGRSVDGFLNGLLRGGIRRLIDVRHYPVSRRYGFHKSTLQRICGLVGIEYQHVPELGVPAAMRQNLTGPEAYRSLFRFYETDILAKHPSSLQTAVGWLRERASVLMCREAAPSVCHRSRLATRLEELSGLPVEHLETGG